MKPFRKRYVVLAVLAALLATCQMEFLKFRKSDKEQAAVLKEKGISDYYFGNIKVGNRNIHFTHVGSDKLPLVLFVHGSPGSSADMLGYLTCPDLGAFQKIALDRPGFGYSDFGKAEPSLAIQAKAVAKLLKKYPVRPAVLVGHSYGGPVVARLSMDYPELVDGIVIIAGALDPGLEPHYWWQKPLNWPIIRNMLPPAFRVSNQEIIPLKSELDSMAGRWSEIKCAVTVVQGLKDQLVHPDNYLFAERKLINAEKLKIDTLSDDGHFVLWTKEKRVTAHIRELMSQYSEEK